MHSWWTLYPTLPTSLFVSLASLPTLYSPSLYPPPPSLSQIHPFFRMYDENCEEVISNWVTKAMEQIRIMKRFPSDLSLASSGSSLSGGWSSSHSGRTSAVHKLSLSASVPHPTDYMDVQWAFRPGMLSFHPFLPLFPSLSLPSPSHIRSLSHSSSLYLSLSLHLLLSHASSDHFSIFCSSCNNWSSLFCILLFSSVLLVSGWFWCYVCVITPEQVW